MNNDKKLAKQERSFREEMLLRSAVSSAAIRRRKIYDLIKKHPFSSFIFISRRFSKINIKTLHYDLKKLQDKGFIIKIGETRGVTYRIKNVKT